MRNLNRKNGSSSSVVVRPRLLPTALAILMKMYSNIQVDTTTRLVNPSLDLNNYIILSRMHPLTYNTDSGPYLTTDHFTILLETTTGHLDIRQERNLDLI